MMIKLQYFSSEPHRLNETKTNGFSAPQTFDGVKSEANKIFCGTDNKTPNLL